MRIIDEQFLETPFYGSRQMARHLRKAGCNVGRKRVRRLMKRIRQRGRDVENGVTEEYIDKVNPAFNEFFFNYRDTPLLIINTNNIDFVANPADFEKLVKKVRSDVQGQEFFNPLASIF